MIESNDDKFWPDEIDDDKVEDFVKIYEDNFEEEGESLADGVSFSFLVQVISSTEFFSCKLDFFLSNPEYFYIKRVPRYNSKDVF